MSSRAIYALSGLAWGLLLGALAAWQVMAMAAGLSWLMLFGDAPWPEALGWLIPLFGLLAFLGVLGACVALGLRTGRRAERAEPFEARRRRVQGIRLLALGLLLGLAPRLQPGRGWWRKATSAPGSPVRAHGSRRCARSVRC